MDPSDGGGQRGGRGEEKWTEEGGEGTEEKGGMVVKKVMMSGPHV
jgi:hypothetical protein